MSPTTSERRGERTKHEKWNTSHNTQAYRKHKAGLNSKTSDSIYVR